MKNRPEATERFPDSKDARPTADHLTDRLLVIPSERKLFESRTPPRVYFARSTIEIVVAFVISVSRPVCSPRLLHRAYNNLLLGPGFFHPFPTSSSTSVSSNIEKPALCRSSKTASSIQVEIASRIFCADSYCDYPRVPPPLLPLPRDYPTRRYAVTIMENLEYCLRIGIEFVSSRLVINNERVVNIFRSFHPPLIQKRLGTNIPRN